MITIFLDFDGVLHSWNEKMFSRVPTFVKLLKLIKAVSLVNSDSSRIRVVFSTSHKVNNSLEKLINNIANIDSSIFSLVSEWDVTPNLGGGFNRYKEVELYIEENNLNYNECIILDDVPELFCIEVNDEKIYLDLEESEIYDSLIENNFDSDSIHNILEFSKSLFIVYPLTEEYFSKILLRLLK